MPKIKTKSDLNQAKMYFAAAAKTIMTQVAVIPGRTAPLQRSVKHTQPVPHSFSVHLSLFCLVGPHFRVIMPAESMGSFTNEGTEIPR